MENITYKARFNQYRDSQVVVKSKRYAFWTLPHLMAEPSVAGSHQILQRDYQEIGALLVNNLGAKLASLLFPGSVPFFKVEPSEALLRKADQTGRTRTEVSAGLAKMELMASKRLFINASYNQLVQAMKHLVVTGNVVLHRDKALRRTSAYGLQAFSLRRDGKGTMLDLIVHEQTSFAGLSPEIQRVLRLKNPTRFVLSEQRFDMNVDMYTRVERKYGKSGTVYYEESQQVEDIDVGTAGIYPEHLCPWTVVAWSLIPGEHYGRGLVEDFAGGFAKLSDLSEALALYGISVMKFVNLVAPGQGANIDELQTAETGEYVQGTKDGVTVHETGDYQKIVAIGQQIEATFSNLARAFMYKGNTRQAERVTAYELQLEAQEANTVLGGNYSSLAESVQVPTAHLLLTEVDPGTLQGIISGDLKLDIEAGIPALGRAAAVQAILTVARDAAAVVPALTQLDKRVNPARLMDLFYAGSSVITSDFFFTADEQAQKDKAEQQINQGQAQIAQADNLSEQSSQIATLG